MSASNQDCLRILRVRGVVTADQWDSLPGATPRRRRTWRRELPEILIEHRPSGLRGQATVAGHRDPQHQWVAGDRQICQRSGDCVAVPAIAPAVRAPPIAGHRRAEDGRRLLIDGGVGDRHAQLDGAHEVFNQDLGKLAAPR
jgi:hypothetical protein